MAFNGSEGSPIEIEAASALTANWRNTNPGQLKAHFIGKERIAELLANDEAMGLRIYYGLDDNGVMQPVITAAKANEDDILDLIMDACSPCPPFCSSDNSLNS